MKKKGFTLIELLAVIVILAIVMVIAIPQVLKVIEKTEMESYRESVELMMHTAEIQYNADEVQGKARVIPEEGLIYEYSVDGKNTIQTQESIDTYGYLNFKGDKPRSGTLTMTKNKKFIVDKLMSKMHNGKYCAIKNLDEQKVTVGKSSNMGCSVDSEESDEVIADKKPCDLEVDKSDSNILYVDSASDLFKLSQDVNGGNNYSGKTIKVRNNLDMSQAQGTCVETFEPIGVYNSRAFSGTFDGGAKTISNLTINKPNSDGVGLFGNVNGTIKGVILDNITVTGNNYVSALAGGNSRSARSITDIIVKNINITGNSEVTPIGSGQGAISNVLIKSGSIKLNSENGTCGLSAFQYGTAINYAVVESLNVNLNKCVSEGYGTKYSNNVKVNNTNVTSGFLANDINDINAYENMNLDTWIGGDNDNSGYYFDYNKKGEITLKSVEKYPFTFSLTGSGTEADPYLITNEQQWKEVSTIPSQTKIYLLTKNLDFSSHKFYMLGGNYNNGTNRFRGTIKGGAKTIKNVTINASKCDNVGIIGLSAGKVVGLTAENIKVTGNDNSGALGSVSDVLEVILKNIDIKGGASVSSNGNMFDLGNVGNIVIKGGKLNFTGTSGNCYSAHSYYGGNNRISPISIIYELQMPSSCNYERENSSYISKNSKIGGSNISNGFNNGDINDINFYEAAGFDTWIGGDNDSSGYYFDYNDAGNEIIIKSVSENPFTFTLSGSGTEADPYLITNEQQWKEVSAKTTTKYYKLTSNLDFSNHKFYMLGSQQNRCGDTIDGGAKTIKNVTINASKANYVGIIGGQYGGSTYGLNLDHINVTGNNYVGALCGSMYSSREYIREIALSNINITGNNYVGALNGSGTGGYNNNSGWLNNILVKSGNVTINTSDGNKYCYSAGIINPYSSSSIVENLSLSSNACSYQNTSTNVYASNNVKLAGTNITDGFNAGNVGDLLYYSGIIETIYSGDTNNTGYFFDYVSSKGGVYVVKASQLELNPQGDPGNAESGGSCSCSSWSDKGNTTYRTNTDATCKGIHYMKSSNGCYSYRIVGTGDISATADSHWICRGKIQSRTCN